MPLGRFLTDSVIVARFWRSVDRHDDEGCWHWLGGVGHGGYGRLYVREVDDTAMTVAAHRFSYALMVGPIPAGLVVHHVCGEPSCVRPDHLEAVSNRTNVLAGTSPSALNARKLTCAHGHPFDRVRSDGARACRACRNAEQRTRRRRPAARGTPALWREVPAQRGERAGTPARRPDFTEADDDASHAGGA
jgi:hypothetical protein